MTTIMTSLDVKEKFTEVLNHVAHQKQRVILTRRGQEIAALVPIEDLQFLENTQDKHDVREAMDALKEAKTSGTVTLEELKETIGSSS